MSADFRRLNDIAGFRLRPGGGSGKALPDSVRRLHGPKAGQDIQKILSSYIRQLPDAVPVKCLEAGFQDINSLKYGSVAVGQLLAGSAREGSKDGSSSSGPLSPITPDTGGSAGPAVRVLLPKFNATNFLCQSRTDFSAVFIKARFLPVPLRGMIIIWKLCL